LYSTRDGDDRKNIESNDDSKPKDTTGNTTHCASDATHDTSGTTHDTSDTTDIASEKEVPKSPLKKKRKVVDADVQEGAETKKVRISDQVDVNVETESGKKKRNRKRNKNKEKKMGEIPELRVLPKLEWLSLKNEYLKMQKTSMQQLKQTLKQYKTPDTNGKGQDQTETSKKDTTPQFVSGVIVKVTSEKELTRKEVKDAVSPLADIVYVDVLEGDKQGYIRCKDSDSANKLLSSTLQSHKICLVEGDEEKKYWDKILADREKKLNTKSKGNKKRGRDKVTSQADKINVRLKRHRADGDSGLPDLQSFPERLGPRSWSPLS